MSVSCRKIRIMPDMMLRVDTMIDGKAMAGAVPCANDRSKLELWNGHQMACTRRRTGVHTVEVGMQVIRIISNLEMSSP